MTPEEITIDLKLFSTSALEISTTPLSTPQYLTLVKSEL